MADYPPHMVLSTYDSNVAGKRPIRSAPLRSPLPTRGESPSRRAWPREATLQKRSCVGSWPQREHLYDGYSQAFLKER